MVCSMGQWYAVPCMQSCAQGSFTLTEGCNSPAVRSHSHSHTLTLSTANTVNSRLREPAFRLLAQWQL